MLIFRCNILSAHTFKGTFLQNFLTEFILHWCESLNLPPDENKSCVTITNCIFKWNLYFAYVHIYIYTCVYICSLPLLSVFSYVSVGGRKKGSCLHLTSHFSMHF